jgi:hypothetical protein
MKTTFNIGKEKYFRLFSIFEKGLKNYSKIFEKEDYVLTYVISKSLLSKDYEVAVTLSIKKNPLWAKYSDEPRNLKTLLQSYCNYFSIKEIMIIRPFKRFERNVATPHISIPLEDRIFFEFFKHQSSLDFLD